MAQKKTVFFNESNLKKHKELVLQLFRKNNLYDPQALKTGAPRSH